MRGERLPAPVNTEMLITASLRHVRRERIPSQPRHVRKHWLSPRINAQPLVPCHPQELTKPFIVFHVWVSRSIEVRNNSWVELISPLTPCPDTSWIR